MIKLAELSEIFSLVMDIGTKENQVPIYNRVWSHKVDELWSFEVNGFPHTEQGIPPFNVKVVFNGFPAGLIGPYDGIIAAGAAANEDTFIQALKDHLKGTDGGEQNG